MNENITPNRDAVGGTDDDSSKREHSRRGLLASIGAGAAGLALSGVTGTASGEESPAGGFIESTSSATTATSDGSWSDSAVWDNGVPTAGQTVRIDAGVTITVDTTTERIKNLDVAGTLTFARDTDSHLRAETIVTRPDSTLDIGTESSPIPPESEARITIVHHEDISEKDDPDRISKGIITMGELEIHGAEKTTWDELATAPTAGDTSIELASAPTNWTEGDEIVIPGLDPSSNEDDERTIASVSGATVELDEPLEYDHVPPENNLDVELTAYALNCTRNVRFESEINESDVTNETRINRQGHLMIMKPAQSISYLEVDHFGRTNKNFWMDDLIYAGDGIHGHGTDEPSEPNVTARYGLHFHKTGIGEDPHEVTGAVVKHSPGWGVVNHSSHANVHDSITYDVFGAGFVAEAGKERGAFERCFALRSEGSRNTSDMYHNFSVNGESPPQNVDFGHEGEGFWLQGPAVAVDDCVAAGHASYAFALWNEALDGNIPDDLANEDGLYEGSVDGTVCTQSGRRQTCKFVEPGTLDPHLLPLKSFSNNTVFASAGGFDYAMSRPDRPSVVDTFTVYNIAPRVDNQYPAGVVYEYGRRGNCMIAERYSSKLKVKNPQFCNVDGADGGHGIRRNYSAEHPPGVYGGVMEGLNVGVQVCIDAAGEDIDDVSFYNNNTDIVFEVPSVPIGGVAGAADSVADLDIHSDTSVTFEFDPNVTSQPDDAAWDGGSGTHTFSVPGEYGFRWPEEDNTPGTITVTQETLEAQGPTAAFDHQSTATVGDSITFDASASSAPSGSISSYEWDFGDGTTKSGKTVDHSFGESGDYTVELTVTTEDGSSQTASEKVTVGEHRPSDDPGDVTEGISYEYFESDGLNSLPNFDALEPVRTGTTGTVGLGPDHREEQFAFRFTGYISVPETGVYTFTTESDDGSELYIGSEQVVDNGGNHGMRKRSGGIALSEGLHEITVIYFQATSEKGLNVFWDGTDTETEQIPGDVLYHTDDQNESRPDADETVTVAPGGSHEFSPADLEIEPGTTVAFEWDAGGHTVTVDSQPDDADWSGVDSTQSEGHEHTHTFDVEGTYEYYCRPHQSQMQGTITVDDTDVPGPITEAIDEDDDGEIDDEEMLDALDYWGDDETVPGTDQTISDQQILDLVDSWQEEGSE